MTQRSLFIVAAIAIAGLYLLGVTNHWSIKPDSGLYLGLGQSLIEGQGMAFNGTQWWGIPPLVPLLAAGGLWLADGQLWLVNLAMTLLALGVVGLTWLVLRRLVADLPDCLRPGVVAGGTLVVALSARLYIDATLVLTDVPFAFFVMLSLYGWLRGRDGHRGWLLVASATLVPAMLTRIVGPVFAAAFVMAMVLHTWRKPDRWRRLGWLVAGSAIMLAAFALWVVLVRSRAAAESVDYLKPSTLALFDPFVPDKWMQVAKGVADIPPAICSTIVYQKLRWVSLIPAALVFVGAVTAYRRRQWLVVLPLVVYPTFLLALGGAMASRYLLPLMPLLVYCLLVGVHVSVHAVRRRAGLGEVVKRPVLAITIVVVICAGISMGRIGREVYWLHHPRFLEVKNHGQWQGLVEVGRYLKQRGRANIDRVLGPQLYILHRVSGLLVTSDIDWQGTRHLHFDDLSPEAFADVAVGGDYRFVVVPTDIEDWSEAAVTALEADGQFGVPVRIHNLAVLERRAPPASAAPDTPPGDDPKELPQ